MFDRATFNAPQEYLRIRGTADQKSRRCSLTPGVITGPRIAEISIGKTQSTQKEYLEEPVENDSDLAEKERRLEVRCRQCSRDDGRDKNIVHHQQRYRQDRCHPNYIQGIRQGDKAPF